MIIDSLTHVTPDGKWFNTRHDASESRLLKELESGSVQKAVVVALADFISNEYVLKTCRNNSNVLIPGASFNPSKYKNAQDARLRFRHELYNSEFALLKLHPRLNCYDPLDPRCLAILDELASWQKRMPVWIDTLVYYKSLHLKSPLVDSFHYLVTSYPNINFVLLHSGGSYLLNLWDAIKDCPNAFLDLSFTILKYKGSSVSHDIKFLMQAFDRRITAGSDFPEFGISEYLNEIHLLGKDLVENSIQKEKLNNILGNNLFNILNNGK